MSKYLCTYWVRTKKECTVEANSEDEALDLVAEGKCGYEREVYEEVDDNGTMHATLVKP